MTDEVARPAVCSIGTIDPWNAAGLGLDILVLSECGVRPLTVVAGISAQDASGVRGLIAIEPRMILAQWAGLARAGVAAIRVGALASAASVAAVASIVEAARLPVVYDPALGPTAGGRFADDETAGAIRTRLLPLVTVCTPNAAEAAELTRVRAGGVAEMLLAGRALQALGARAALVTGGDLDGDPCDVLVDDDGECELIAPRVAGTMRGTGCVLAAALAAELARGAPLRAAVERARAFVRKKIAGARASGDFRVAY